LSSAGILRTRGGSSEADTSNFFAQITLDFRNLVCPHRKVGWASADIFRTRGRGQFLAVLCGHLLSDILDGPL